MKHLVILFCLAVAMGHVSVGQQEKGNTKQRPVLQAGIKVIAKAYGDSIVLRWAPTRPWAWNKLNYLGYMIERISLDEKDNAKKAVLSTTALKPYSLDKFKAVFKATNNNAAIAAQCLYGKNFDMNLRKGQGGIEDKATVSDARYGYTLMVADYDAGVGSATALRFADKNVKKGTRYLYRVFPGGLVSQGTIDTGAVLIENTPLVANGKPEITEGIAFDHLSELHWDRNGAQTWSGFFIERSEDNKTFKPLNELPFVSSPPDTSALKKDSSKSKLFAMLQTQHVYIDSFPQNYKNYYYRIRGINAFAEISDYSNTVTISGRDLTAPVAVNILNPRFISSRSIKLLWNKEVIEPDCKGYYITRAQTINGPYETLNQQALPSTTTEFTDNNAFAHGGNFYIVVAVDTAGNIGSSVPAMGLVPDNTAPAIPVGLKGRIERNGLVNLSWDANKEDDVKGYKVYFSNAPDHVFTQVTTAPDTALNFTDSVTLRTLTKEIWYKIAAVDYNNNHSGFSAAIRLKKPDIVPPTAPVATNINIAVQNNRATMDWIQSSSADAVSYIVYRTEESGAAKAVGNFKHNASLKTFHFEDSTIRSNIAYVYTAKTMDEDSLWSPVSLPVNIQVHRVLERPAITSLKAIYDEKEKNIRVSWQYNEKGDYFFILSASEGNGPRKPLRSFNKELNEFKILHITKGMTYSYFIQAIWKDEKGNTRTSEPAGVHVPM